MKTPSNYWKDQKVVVTGASGLIGSQLCTKLLTLGADVLGIVRHSIAAPFTTYTMDLCSIQQWINLLQNKPIVYHLAANTSLNWCEQNPMESMKTNVEPILALCEAASKTKTMPRVIFTGAATQIGLNTKVNINEDMPDVPVSIYDLHKNYAESQLLYATRKNQLFGISLRLANVYGPGKNTCVDRNILSKVIQRAITDQEITIYGDGDLYRDYIYIDDTINALIAAAEMPSEFYGRHYLIGTGCGHTLQYVFTKTARLLEKKIHKPIRVYNIPWPDKTPIINKRSTIIASTRFKQISAWQPLTSLPKGLERTIIAFV